MRVAVSLVSMCLVPFALCWAQPQPKAASDVAVHVPAYTEDGRLLPQADYREWVYLTSGMDMSYFPPAAGAATGSVFDNLFVNPEAFHSFLNTGTWPDKTIMALELRGAESKGSINKLGHFQGERLMSVEFHVKDESRGGWAFYEFSGNAPAGMIPKSADCYSCHRDHAAVDTTFVQFYPTLLPLAKRKGTLSAAYLKEIGSPAR